MDEIVHALEKKIGNKPSSERRILAALEPWMITSAFFFFPQNQGQFTDLWQ